MAGTVIELIEDIEVVGEANKKGENKSEGTEFCPPCFKRSRNKQFYNTCQAGYTYIYLFVRMRGNIKKMDMP